MFFKNKKNEIIESEESNVDMELFEAIQMQGGITFKDPTHIVTGDGYIKIIHIYKLPSRLNDFWLNNLLNIDDCITTMCISTRNKNEVKKNISKSLEEEYSRELHAKDFAEAYDAQRRQEQLQNLYDEIQAMGEVVKDIHFRIFVPAKSLVECEQRAGQIMKDLEGDGYMPCILLNEQENEWKSLFMNYKTQMEQTFAMRGLTLMTEQIAGGYPFKFSSLEDETGDLLGFTNIGGVVCFDEFTKTKRRKHYNSVVIGDMGSGKSTLLKKRFRSRAERGDIVRTFDISGEFTNLTYAFGGKVIKCDGTAGMLNPLEILKSGDDENTNYVRNLSKVTVFYKCLIPNTDFDTVLTLQNLLNGLYDSFGLSPKEGNRVTGRPANEYPTFSDFIKFTEKFIDVKKLEIENMENVSKELELQELQRTNSICKALKSIVKSYGKLFDGITSLDDIMEAKIVTFDISTIKDMNNVFVAQMFNMLYYCWDNMVANGQMMKELYETGKIDYRDVTRSILFVDESHRWVNTSYPELLDLVTIMMREARKYFAGIVLASQSFRDFVSDASNNESIAKLKVVFELTQYKFILKQDSSVLTLIDSLFGNVLAPWQREKIPFLEQGETILNISGDKNIYFKIWLSDEYEKLLFAGGV